MFLQLSQLNYSNSNLGFLHFPDVKKHINYNTMHIFTEKNVRVVEFCLFIIDFISSWPFVVFLTSEKIGRYTDTLEKYLIKEIR